LTVVFGGAVAYDGCCPVNSLISKTPHAGTARANGPAQHNDREATMDAINLARGYLVRIENARDLQVRVEKGAVWITQERDTRDVMLESGQSFRLDRDGTALMSACGRDPFTLISVSRT
jgi:DUF2917 family protein